MSDNSLPLPKNSTMPENIEKFLNRVAEAAERSTLVKMTLSKPVQKHDELRNIYVKPVLIKGKHLFAFTYHYERRDEVKNYDATQMLDVLKEMVPDRFLNAVLFTVDEDQGQGDPPNQESTGMSRAKPGTRQTEGPSHQPSESVVVSARSDHA